jgi:uncharacterized protein YecE (DUF72 family)
MNFRLGCAIWAYKEWVGDLFPKGSRASDFLKLYSRRFTTVEGNTTFYSIPSPDTVKRWAEQTPADFRFCPKLPREVTHQGLLVPELAGAIAFVHLMQGLGQRLGPLLLQLPPSYGPAQWDDLIAFLQAFPRDQVELAIEVRHPDWFQVPQSDCLNQILTDLGIGRVLLDSRPIYDCPDNPQLYSERKKPRLPLQPVTTADFSLIRYISHPDLELNQAFLQEWVNYTQTWLQQGKQLYFFVHCPVEAHSPRNTQQFQILLEQAAVPVPALPWNLLQEETPAQLSLF